jgi:tetratricopeptide (TPR) repeat protein
MLASLALSATALAEDAETQLQDLYFGEAIFYAKQGLYFDALERLDTELAQHYSVDEPFLDALNYHINDAEFSVGDFELNYRMHHRAGRAISAVLEGNVEEVVRNEAAYRLARIHFQKDQLEEALQALDRISGKIPEGLGGEIDFLKANVLIASGRPAEAAEILRRLQNEDGLVGFAGYNMGIALLEDGQHQRALEQLDRAGQVDIPDPETRSIRDKANLVRGTLLMEAEAFQDALVSLDRVSIEGPLSNQALLQAGWAAASTESFERAIVPWSILAGREDTDANVQEARLALPFAYGQLGIYGRAALLYGEALESFDTEAGKLDQSIDSIRNGDFLEALVREEIRRDKDWVIQLRQLPESPETFYMMELLASQDFQTALQNFLDLEEVQSRLETWDRSFGAYEDMIEIRRQYYEPLLPEIDQSFRELDSRIRLRREQHRLLSQRLQDLLTTPRPEFLSTNEERLMASQLDSIENALQESDSPQTSDLLVRVRRLRGALLWTLVTEYHERLTAFDQNLRNLQAEIDATTKQYESFVRARQAAVHSFEGYSVPIRRLQTRVGSALSAVELLMARQGHILELVAVDELLARRERLNHYRDQARFALADSYDRATKAREIDLDVLVEAGLEQSTAQGASR